MINIFREQLPFQHKTSQETDIKSIKVEYDFIDCQEIFKEEINLKCEDNLFDNTL